MLIIFGVEFRILNILKIFRVILKVFFIYYIVHNILQYKYLPGYLTQAHLRSYCYCYKLQQTSHKPYNITTCK